MAAHASITAKKIVTVTVDPGSILDGNVEEIAVTVPGAVSGDFVATQKETEDSIYIIAAWVSDTDEVTLVFFNPSSGTVNADSQSVSVMLF